MPEGSNRHWYFQSASHLAIPQCKEQKMFDCLSKSSKFPLVPVAVPLEPVAQTTYLLDFAPIVLPSRSAGVAQLLSGSPATICSVSEAQTSESDCIHIRFV